MEQTDPVLQEEYILRRVPFDKNNKYIDRNREEPFSILCFNPSSEDDDGLSVCREEFVSVKEMAVKHMKATGKECYVVRILAKKIMEENISIVPDPNNYLDGHCLIPELNINDLDLIKKVIRKKLRDKLNLEDVVHWPKGE